VNDAVRRFVDDLLDAGIGTQQSGTLTSLYKQALTAGTAASWRRLYRAIFSALQVLSQEPSPTTPGSSAARASLMRIVADDLGSEIFGKAAVNRLRDALTKYDVSHGGDGGTRTPDPLHAKQVLYQLSYIPMGRFGQREDCTRRGRHLSK
jgi:hypothetical protein